MKARRDYEAYGRSSLPDLVTIPVPLELRGLLARLVGSETQPTEITVTRTGEATFAQAARRTSTVLAGAGAGTVFIDGEVPTPLQRPPSHPAQLYAKGFLEAIARKLYAARMAGYTPSGAVAAAVPSAPITPWDQLTEGTRELWRNVASVAVLQIAELSPPTLDLSPAEVEALDQGIKAALTIGMLDPRRSATDKDATAKVLQYIRDQRERFTAAAVAGLELHFAPAPSGPVTMISAPAEDPKDAVGILCTRFLPGAGSCQRLAAHSEEGGCTADRGRAAELDKRDFKRAPPPQCLRIVLGTTEQCLRQKNHSGAGQPAFRDSDGQGCTADPDQAKALDAREFKGMR